MAELRILGEIALKHDDGTDVGEVLRQPKRLALLSYLACPSPGTWHRRDMVLALFWPDLDMSHARTSLRNSVYGIRQALGDSIIRNRGDEEISIDPAALRTDLSAFWDALRAGDVDNAIELYRGELLPGLYPSDSDGFHRWLDSERIKIKSALTSAGSGRIDELTRANDVAGALRIAHRMMTVEPDDETLVRRAIELHAKAGDKAGALSIYEAYRTRLASDFEAEPARETIDLVERLKGSAAASQRPRARVEKRDSSPPIDLPSIPARRVNYLPWIAGTIIVAALVAATAFFRREAGAGVVGRSVPVTVDEGLQVEAAISPNGRIVAYARGTANKLRIFVHRIDGGPEWPLTTDTADVQLMPRWGPDSDEILFLWRNSAWLAPAVGGSARVVATGGDGDAMVRSASWSPSGDSVLIVRNDSLLVQPLRGHDTRFIASRAQLHSCTWSPNGKWIACVAGNWIAFTPGPLFGNDAPSEIVIFPARGGAAIDVTGSDFKSDSPAWSEDGRYLWYLSDRDGIKSDAYAVAIANDGTPAAAPIRMGIRAESISLSAGRIAYSTPSRKANIWSIPIPRDSAISATAGTRVTSGNQVVELIGASRDGKWLLYDSQLRGNADIYRAHIDGTDVEQLTDDPRREFAPDLSPDGKEFVWQRFVKGQRHLFVKRLDADSAHEIIPSKGDQGVPRWSPDGNAIVAWSHDHERGAVFVVRRDANGRWKRPSWRLDYGQLPTWSPDGKEIAFVTLDGRVQVIPSDSGAIRTVYTPRARTGDPLAIFVKWHKPEAIWMTGQTPQGQNIWELSLKTGRARMLVRNDDPVGRAFAPVFASDSSHFYLARTERSSNIQWADLERR